MMCIDDETFERLWLERQQHELREDSPKITGEDLWRGAVWFIVVPATFTASAYISWTVCSALARGIAGLMP